MTNSRAYATKGRDRMTAAFLAAEPRLVLHGHHHLKDEIRIEHFEHATHVVSVDCDGAPDGNLLIVSLPDRDRGREADVVKVLDEGRSVHWKALARVHRRDDFRFGSLLSETLVLTRNEIARDYLHRVLSGPE